MELDGFPDVITAASGSPLGIVALALLLLALIAWMLFVKGGQSSERTRLGVYGMFTAGVLFLAMAIVPAAPDPPPAEPDAPPPGAGELPDTSTADTASAEGPADPDGTGPADPAPSLARGIYFYGAAACEGDPVQRLTPGQQREVPATAPIRSLRLVDLRPVSREHPLVIGLTAGPRARALVLVQRPVADHCVPALEQPIAGEAVRLERSGGGTLAGQVRRIRIGAPG